MDKYDDIINLPHYEPKYHPRMSKYKRSAQFAPFAALVGYDEQVQECSRLTDKRLKIDDELKEKINYKLNKINELIKNNPVVEITYFIPDVKKDGGKYITEKGKIMNRRMTGACAKHQRHIAQQVKYARFMALIPFVK